MFGGIIPPLRVSSFIRNPIKETIVNKYPVNSTKPPPHPQIPQDTIMGIYVSVCVGIDPSVCLFV